MSFGLRFLFLSLTSIIIMDDLLGQPAAREIEFPISHRIFGWRQGDNSTDVCAVLPHLMLFIGGSDDLRSCFPVQLRTGDTF